LADVTGELMRLGPLRAARAEAAWLSGDPALAAAEAEREHARAVRAGERWLAGRLAIWLHRGGRRVEQTARLALAEPFALEIAGDGKAAAEMWYQRGYPIEAARALVAAGDEESLRQALTTFDRLCAKPDAARTVQALRAIGARNIPRGPRAETRANVAQLTARELDVLSRVTEGQSNREIAEALFLSPRTVGHHVSAILSKLQISSRTEARAQVEALGLYLDRSSAVSS
jgi:DNA-binding CsgD family transcriptional regulator